MCDSTTQIEGVKVAVAPATDELKMGPWQPLQPLAIIDTGSGATIGIDDLLVNGQSLFTKFDEDSDAGAGPITSGLGLVTNLTAELIRSGANPFPPSPLVDQNNKLSIIISGVAAQATSFYIYWGNPAITGKVAVGNMQKNGGANYHG